MYGVVPGSSVDAKVVANGYGYPLIAIKGRNNEGRVQMYAMGYLERLDPENYKWFFEKFASITQRQPRLLTTDQDAAMLTAAAE